MLPIIPLSEREKQLLPELRRDVEYLAREVGERSARKHWEVAAAADWIAGEFEAAGFSVNRTGVESDGEAIAMDIEANSPGGKGDVVLVTAHYDSSPGSPGADDGATGIAALLALARGFKGLHSLRTIRFLARASKRNASYAQRLGQRGDAVPIVLGLESLGYYSDQANSQRCPRLRSVSCSSVGDFAAILATERTRRLGDWMARSLGERTSVPVRPAVVSDAASAEFELGSWVFHQAGWPLVAITDTGPLRNPHHDGPADTVEHLDFERLARLVSGIERVLRVLVGLPENADQDRLGTELQPKTEPRWLRVPWE
ncbi:M28 family peptidase [Myxococcota bacterium]